MVRPEEIEVAATRDGLASSYLARGVVEEVALHRRARAAAHAPRRRRAGARCCAFGDGDADSARSRSRARSTSSAASKCARADASRSACGACTCCRRRCRASPPARASAALAQALSRQPLLAELAARMKTRIAHAHRAAAGPCRRAVPGQRRLRRHDRDRRRSPRRAAGRVAAAPRRARPAGAAARGARPRSGCSSTGPGRRHAAQPLPSPRACCATCRPRRSMWASSPDRLGEASAPAGHARAAGCAFGGADSAWPGDAHRAALRRRRRRSWRAASPKPPGRC